MSTFTDLISSEEHQFLKHFKPTFAHSATQSKSAPIAVQAHKRKLELGDDHQEPPPKSCKTDKMLPSNDKEDTREGEKMTSKGNMLSSTDKDNTKKSDKIVSKEKEKKIKTRTNLVRPP